MKKRLSFPSVFFGVLVHPRETVRKVIRQKYYSFVLPFVCAYALLGALNPMYVFIFSKHLPVLVVLPVLVLGVLALNLVSFYLFAWLLFRIGKELGGKGKLEAVRAAYALVYPPLLLGIVLKFLIDIPVWYKIFANMDHPGDLSMADFASHNLLSSIPLFIFCIWMLFPWIINISEVHQFSKWKAFGTQLAIFAVFFVIFLGLALTIVLAVVLAKVCFR